MGSAHLKESIMVERYPEGTTTSIEDFRRSSWRDAVDFSGRKGYHSLWRSLSEAASAAIQSGDLSQGKVLWLMADACSMMLKPASTNEPFKPIMVMEGKRTSISEDFLEQDINLFAQISEEVTEPLLMEALDHSTTTMASRYAHLANEHKSKIANHLRTTFADRKE
jgi:hypothetical protein